jgi:hypothetical protein
MENVMKKSSQNPAGEGRDYFFSFHSEPLPEAIYLGKPSQTPGDSGSLALATTPVVSMDG